MSHAHPERVLQARSGWDATQPPRMMRGRRDVPLSRFVSAHHALPVLLRARRTVVILVVVIVFAYVVGDLAGFGDAVAVAASTAMVGVVAERLTRLILRCWIRVVWVTAGGGRRPVGPIRLPEGEACSNTPGSAWTRPTR